MILVTGSEALDGRRLHRVAQRGQGRDDPVAGLQASFTRILALKASL